MQIREQNFTEAKGHIWELEGLLMCGENVATSEVIGIGKIPCVREFTVEFQKRAHHGALEHMA